MIEFSTSPAAASIRKVLIPFVKLLRLNVHSFTALSTSKQYKQTKRQVLGKGFVKRKPLTEKILLFSVTGLLFSSRSVLKDYKISTVLLSWF